MTKTTQVESLPRLTAQNVIFKISSLYLVDTVKIIQLENRKIHCNQLKTTIMDLHSVYFSLSDSRKWKKYECLEILKDFLKPRFKTFGNFYYEDFESETMWGSHLFELYDNPTRQKIVFV